MPAPPTALSYAYLTASQIEARLRTLAAKAPQLCQIEQLAPTVENRRAVVLRVRHPAAPSNAIPVLFTAGLHAREWAPPDILVDFAERLVGAAGSAPDFVASSVSYRPFAKWQLTSNPDRPFARRKDTRLPIVQYKAVQVPRDAVQRILSKLEIYIAPLINIDGRVYSQSATPGSSSPPVWIWRKNRRPTGGSCAPELGLDTNFGVDINRNFDFAWDASKYYHPDSLANDRISFSTDPCDFQSYRGSAPASEVETQNVVGLMRGKKIQFYVDIHAHAHAIYHWWGTAQSGRDPSQSFVNRSKDGQRYAYDASKYAEFLPRPGPSRPGDETFRLLAHTMRQSMIDAVDSARATLAGGRPRGSDSAFASSYEVGPASIDYAATGTAPDYFNSLQFTSDPAGNAIALDPARFAYTLECGSKEEGAFWPERNNELPKISREVHAALWYLLSYAATPFGGAATWPIVPGTP